MSFQDLPEPKAGEHERDYVQRCSSVVMLKNPDMGEAKAIALCTTYYRNRDNNLDDVTLKVTGTGKKREDGFLDLNGKLHGLDEYTDTRAYGIAKRVVSEEMAKTSRASEAFEKIDALQRQIKDQGVRISVLANRLDRLGEIKEVKEMLDGRPTVPIRHLRDAIPNEPAEPYGIKQKLTLNDNLKKSGRQQGIVAAPHPADEEDRKILGKPRLRDFAPR